MYKRQGLENINVKGALLGLSKKQIQEIIDGVIEFAELGDFLYQPVKKYSSGMKSRPVSYTHLDVYKRQVLP